MCVGVREVLRRSRCWLHGRMTASIITSKPAIRYQFKTGQRDWPKT